MRNEAGSVSDLTESALIARISGRLPPAPSWIAVGIGDDAAVVEPERNRLEVLSVDALVEGVHFDRAFTPPAAIGHRALAVNLSDLAAMGATPRLALLSLALPPSLLLADFDEMTASLIALAARFRIAIVGGNLTRIDGPLVIDVTVLGTVKRRQFLTRGGARSGDDLYVSGTVGSAAAGLQMLKSTVDSQQSTVNSRQSTVDSRQSTVDGARSTADGRPATEDRRLATDDWRLPTADWRLPTDDWRLATDDRLVRRYLYPEPRVRLGSLLGRNRAATACIDLSDGLAEGVHQLAKASSIGATIDAAALPIDADARRWFEQRATDAVHEAITGGDDYELLIAVRPRVRGRVAAAERHGGTPLTRIGSCTTGRAVVLRQNGADRPLPRGYSHFR